MEQIQNHGRVTRHLPLTQVDEEFLGFTDKQNYKLIKFWP